MSGEVAGGWGVPFRRLGFSPHREIRARGEGKGGDMRERREERERARATERDGGLWC